MNFFKEQERARFNTAWLLVLMALAVTALAVITTFAVVLCLYLAFLGFLTTSLSSFVAWWWASGYLAGIMLAVVAVIAAGSLFKWLELGNSGANIAMRLGGKRVYKSTEVLEERRLVNIVEEMAIASGNPVPEIYILEEPSINAFVAGTDRRNVVIAVTRGCITQLNRDQLQGVIAHEFSHIYSGDMRLNFQLVTMLHGILGIGNAGEMIIRSQQKDAKQALKWWSQDILGLSLVTIGSFGLILGSAIKAAVCRQREFLADAAAVQFTRDPSGIADALKIMGGSTSGSLLKDPHAVEYSHFYFGQGVPDSYASWFDTHPPLADRIRRIEPSWDGRFITTHPVTEPSTPSSAGAPHSKAEAMAALAAASSTLPSDAQQPTLTEALETVGNPGCEHLAYAHNLLERLPQTLVDAAHNPTQVFALIYGLLLDRENPAEQLEALRTHVGSECHEATRLLKAEIDNIHRSDYLPLIELAMPALKEQPAQEYSLFRKNLVRIIRANQKISLLEWCLFKTVTLTIEGHAPRGDKKLGQLMPEVIELLRAVCVVGGTDVSSAFDAARELIPQLPAEPPQASRLALADIEQVLTRLAHLMPLEKPRLLKAIARCIEIDGVVKVEEATLFRVIADSLNCPVPPILGVERP